MKTPEEIKKGLECCLHDLPCAECPYDNDAAPLCYDCNKRDALAYIQQLEETIGNFGHLNETMHNEAKKGIQELESRLAQVERERDALMRDFRLCVARPRKACYVCKNKCMPICNKCNKGDAFEWRGVREENTKEG